MNLNPFLRNSSELIQELKLQNEFELFDVSKFRLIQVNCPWQFDLIQCRIELLGEFIQKS